MITNAVSLSRQVPSGPAMLKLEGRNVYGAPIQEIVMAGSVRSISEVIEVDLKSDATYHVYCNLADGKDAIWLEVGESREHVGTRVAPK